MQAGWLLIRKIEDKYISLEQEQQLNAPFDWRSMKHKKTHKKDLKTNIVTVKAITMKTPQNKIMQVRAILSVNI